MASTLSVSKGVFVLNQKKFVKGRKSSKNEQILLYSDPWYIAYKQTWKSVETNVMQLQQKTFSDVLNSLVTFVKNTYCNEVENNASIIPTAALLTGINMPDHGALFSTLTNLLCGEVSPHIAVLQPHKCKTVRHAIEQMTSQFMNSTIDEELDSEDSDEEKIVKVKKSQSNMLVLRTWYYESYPSLLVKSSPERTRKRKLDLEEDFSDGEMKESSPCKRKKHEICMDSEEQENEHPKNSPQKYRRVKMEDEVCNLSSPRKKDNNSSSPLKLPVRSSPRKALGLRDDPNLLYKSSPKILKSQSENSSLTPRSPTKSRKSLKFTDDVVSEHTKMSFTEDVVVKYELQNDVDKITGDETLINHNDNSNEWSPAKHEKLRRTPSKSSVELWRSQRFISSDEEDNTRGNETNMHTTENKELIIKTNNYELFKQNINKASNGEFSSKELSLACKQSESPTKSPKAKLKENSMGSHQTPEKSLHQVDINSQNMSSSATYKLSCSQMSDNSNARTFSKQLPGEVTPKKTLAISSLIANDISNNLNPFSPSRSKRINELIEEEIGRTKRTPKKNPSVMEKIRKTPNSASKEKYPADCSDEDSIVSSPIVSDEHKGNVRRSARTPRSARKSINYSELSDDNMSSPDANKFEEIHKKGSEKGSTRSSKQKLYYSGRELSKQSTKIEYNEELNTEDERHVANLQNESRGRLKRTPKKVSRLIQETENECIKRKTHTPSIKTRGSGSTKKIKSRSKVSCYSDEELDSNSTNREIDYTLNRKQETPQKNKTPLDEMKHSDVYEDSINEKWICELSKVSPSTPLKIPKIILKQADRIICEKYSPKQLSPSMPPITNSFSASASNEELSPRRSPRKVVESPKDWKVSKMHLHCFKSNDVKSEDKIRKKLIVVIPEFEKFPSKVLQDFILILRNSIPALPIVLIMGIATSVAAVHRSLPYRMSACLSMKAFQSPSSVRLLNSVLEEILFSSACPFWLGGRTFSFLMDVFLCYDLSVKGFVQAFKYCMMEHFCGQPWKILCCRPDTLIEKKGKLTAKDVVALRNLPSFSLYWNNLENEEEKEKLKKDDAYMKKTAMSLIKQLHETMDVFHISLKCLNVLVHDLPQNPLGTQIRELYGIGVSSPINKTPEYKECFKFLSFLSREELVSKVDKILELVQAKKDVSILSSFAETLNVYKRKVQDACVTSIVSQQSPTKNIIAEGKMSRYAFKDKLFAISRKEKYTSPFEIARGELMDYLSSDAFPKLLKPPATLPFAEVLIFDDLQRVRSHIVGIPRAAIHTALLNPQMYLQCDCCILTEKGAILPTMPDICIAFKLYRECGRMINLYDWLQAFSSIVNPQSNEDSDDKTEKQIHIDPHVHARFSRAVAELQFMGFLKSSGRKVDHVTKLCFDGGF